MRNSTLIILIFVLSTIVFGQRNFRKFQNNPFQIFYPETNIIPSDSLYLVYFSYRIPYNKIVFEKDNNVYKAGYSLSVEVVDSSSNFIARQLDEKRITVNTFEETNNENLFAQGVIKFKIKKGRFNIIPIFTDINSNIEMKSHEIPLFPDKFNSKIYYHPIIVNSKKVNNGKEEYELTNFGGSIPFNESSYDLIIPVSDENLSKLHVVMLNNKDTVTNTDISQYFTSSLSLNYNNDIITLNNSENNFQTKNFVIKNFSSKLYEGELTLIVTNGDDTKSKKIFNLNVRWFNKPASLMDPEYAIKALKYAENENVIDSMLDENDEDYPKALFKYWAKNDPTPNTAYNPLMKEYYSRIDYAAKNFSTITGKSGVNTDRGRIFIQFGKPQKVDRYSNDKGKIVETWFYENPKRKFIFTDLTGTGNFLLQDS